MLEKLAPERVFYHFEQICRIPHGSGNPQGIGDYCAAFAERHALEYRRDAFGNVVICKDGDRARAPVILQGHLDMVCVADEGVSIDFRKDPLPVDTDGESVFCRGTSLGADDGIAAAMILALLEDDTLHAPPIEAVLTMDEETGMYGAIGLDCAQLRGRRMLNLDTEEEGNFCVSCAGGERVTIDYTPRFEPNTSEASLVRLTGLQGGHSGTEIDKGRLNAVLCMAQLLARAGGRIASFSGGTVGNAIPSGSEAVWIGEADALREAFSALSAQWLAVEPEMKLQIEACPAPSRSILPTDGEALLQMLAALPSGVQAYSRDIDGLVETSLNLGVCTTDDAGVHLHYSVRSSVDASRDALVERVERIASDYGASAQRGEPYPAWQYRADSPLRDTAVRISTELFGKKPQITAIHAGLECGLFAGKIDGLDCISLGPDILNIHSPQERLSVASTARTYALVRRILESLE